jgi:hypothetical protein
MVLLCHVMSDVTCMLCKSTAATDIPWIVHLICHEAAVVQGCASWEWSCKSDVTDGS